MFDSLPHNSPGLFKMGGGQPAAKLSINGQLSSAMLDSIFGAGSGEALAAQMRASPADAFTRQGWFRKCVDVRAKGVSTLPWAVYAEGSDMDYADALMTEADPAPPDALAPLEGIARLLYLSEASLTLSGQFYLGKLLDGPGSRPGAGMGRLRGLAYWSPYHTTPDWSGGGLSFRRVVNGRTVERIDPETVVYGWQPDPLVEMGPGSSDGGAAARNAAVLDALTRFLGDHLNGGLIKMTVLSTKDGQRMTPEQASNARSAWQRFLRRLSPREGPPVLNNIEPHVIGEGLKELSNEVLTKEQREAIATACGIPWSVLMASAANYATAEVEERGFLLRTVIPQSRIIADAFNRHLLGEYGYCLKFEPERSEIMQQFELEKAEKVAIICGGPVLTKNEGRQLLGYEEIEDEAQLDTVEDEPEAGDGSVRSLPSAVAGVSLSDKLDRLIGEGL